MRTLLSIAAITLLLILSGCYTTFRAPEDRVYYDGFHEEQVDPPEVTEADESVSDEADNTEQTYYYYDPYRYDRFYVYPYDYPWYWRSFYRPYNYRSGWRFSLYFGYYNDPYYWGYDDPYWYDPYNDYWGDPYYWGYSSYRHRYYTDYYYGNSYFTSGATYRPSSKARNFGRLRPREVGQPGQPNPVPMYGTPVTIIKSGNRSKPHSTESADKKRVETKSPPARPKADKAHRVKERSEPSRSKPQKSSVGKAKRSNESSRSNPPAPAKTKSKKDDT